MLGVMEDMLQYREYMAQALELARKGAGWVDPNPLVGAVVVRDGEVLATGYHDRYRGPHAERMAFDYADAHGIDLTGATVIDTLEPCCHVGSQPACTALILAHGIARVMREECDAINRHFFHCITTGKPYIVDGRRRAGESDSEYAVRRRELYATYAAVLAGTESDVPDESFAHFNGPVQAVGADEVVIGGHRPLLLEAGALACTDPDEWLRELGKRKIDGLIVESDEAFERLSMACQKD